MSDDCPRRNKWIGGCRFEGRYSEGAPTQRVKTYGYWDSADSVELVKATRSRTYEGDVCVRCGRFAPRPAPVSDKT